MKTFYDYFKIFPETALNCLIGKPATCIWETSVTGYRATLWRVVEGCSYPEMSRSFDTKEQAEKWAKKNFH